MTYLYPFLYIDFLNYQKSAPINKKINPKLEKKIIDLINKVRDNDYYLLKNTSQSNFFKELDDIFIKEPDILFDLNISDCLIKNFNWNENDNVSIIFYSTEIDEYNHFYGKNHIYSLLQAYIAEKMIMNLMNWIDEHPDYALIINSDHGGQHFYGEDIIRNHGEDFPGNEGIFFIYTKDFKDDYDNLKMNERYISIIDESTLMSEILLNINIPLESKGIPYPLINDEIFTYSSLKRKELQLIKLIVYYETNYENNYKSKELRNILKELNQSFEGIDEIKFKYFNKDKTEQKELMKELKQINKNNLDRLINQQNKINEILINNNSNINITIVVIIFVIVCYKAILECIYIFGLLVKNYYKYYTSLGKFIFVVFIMFYSYIFEFIFLFFSDTETKLEFFVQLYIFITCIILFIIKIIISCQNTPNIKLEKKIYYYFLMLAGYLSFQVISEYSYSLNNIKSFFSRQKPQLLLNLFFLYPLLILYTINEIKKFDVKNKNKKGIYVFIYIIIINVIFIISILLEDLSYKTYYSQNILNKISMFIALIVYIIYFFSCFIINTLDFQITTINKFCISNRIELNYNNSSNIIPIKLKENDNESINTKKK